eukprot:scaffold43696_cov48-Attheya_sp.AAC.4
MNAPVHSTNTLHPTLFTSHYVQWELEILANNCVWHRVSTAMLIGALKYPHTFEYVVLQRL